jgi:hypothetical protein
MSDVLGDETLGAVDAAPHPSAYDRQCPVGGTRRAGAAGAGLTVPAAGGSASRYLRAPLKRLPSVDR